MTESLILMSLRELDWISVLKNIGQLSPVTKSSERWQYWQARAASQSQPITEIRSI